MILLTFIFPGGEHMGYSSDGIYDYRGENCIKAVRDVVTRTDGEGTPLTYFPRRLIKVMERQSDLMQTQTRLIEKMHDHLSEHENREEALLDEMKNLLKALVANSSPQGGA